MVERWNGTSWSILPSPNPPGPTRADLLSVACTSLTNCDAVGGYQIITNGRTDTPDTTLAEHWNGTSWSIIPTPNPTDTTAADLNGIACPTPTTCTATGNYFTNDSSYTLTEQGT